MNRLSNTTFVAQPERVRRPSEPNPCHEATFVELQHACAKAIKALEQRAVWTRAEKALFAKPLRCLLIAV